MRPVCVPFFSNSAATALSFVALTRLYVSKSSFFLFCAVLCHDQFTARHMTAPSASEDLKDFVCNPSLSRFSLPHTKRAFVFSSHFGHQVRVCPSFFFCLLLPGYYLEDRSHQITANRNQLAVANNPKMFPSSFIASFQWGKAIVNPAGCIHDLDVRKSVFL